MLHEQKGYVTTGPLLQFLEVSLPLSKSAQTHCLLENVLNPFSMKQLVLGDVNFAIYKEWCSVSIFCLLTSVELIVFEMESLKKLFLKK